MSWMKRGQAGAGTGAQPYAAPQPQAQSFGNQQNMYPNYQGGTAQPQAQPPQQFWQPAPQPLPAPAQQPPQQYNQPLQYGQPYSQDYPTNANQHQPAPQAHYNQNYTNQYTNPQANYQQNFYQNQLQQNYAQNPTNAGSGNAEGWDENWDWSWDENAKKAQGVQNTPQPLSAQQQLTNNANNANVIEESFASTDSWNWAMNERKESTAPAAAPPKQDNEPAVLQSNTVRHHGPPPQNNISNQQAEEVKTLGDTEAIKERLPNLALGKRFHLENLTPQWSIESQMSQESSDGPHTLSEGTYRSDNQSRNSGESPGPNMDNSNYNYAQGGFDETYTQNSEWTKNSDEATVAKVSQNTSRRESHEELSNSLQEMSIANDHQSKNGGYLEPRNIQEHMGNKPPPSISPPNFPAPAPHNAPPSSVTMPPPPPVSAALPPRPPSSTLVSPAPPVSHPPQQPPSNFAVASLPHTLPPPSNSQNPFQRAGPLSHKSINRSTPVPPPPFQSQMPPGLASPAVVGKVVQSRGVVGFEANLETTPDNSERPDQAPATLPAPPPASLAAPDNLEVAPQHDRNQYLQTAHLSGSDYGENTDFTRTLPPPGLRRMVLGQQESDYRSRNMSGDEPPPGLARMVPGQHTEPDSAYDQPNDDYMHRHIDGQPTEGGASARPFRQADGQQHADDYSQQPAERRPPVPFDRMVPGEPSDDEYSQYQGSNYAANEQRVVTGLDRDYPLPAEAGPSDVREQNVDGSDYTEPPRSALAVRDPSDPTQEFAAPDECVQREVTVEGENLQDLSLISSAELTFSRERLDGAAPDAADAPADRLAGADAPERPATGERKHSLNRLNTSGDDSERDRAFKSSPRRDRRKSSRDRDRDRNHDRDRDKEARYSRGDRNDRKYDRDDRRRDDKRTDKERRERGRGGDASPDARKHRRSTRARKYDDEDTDYYSDKERERRRYREGSYSTKPPRGEDRERRYNTAERERRDRPRDPPRDPARRDRDRYDRHYADYRDIDPSRKYGNLHRERETERRRVTFSTDAKTNDSRSEGEASRPESREAGGTDEEGADRRSEARRRPRHARAEPYHDGYGGAFQDPYLLQRQQYEYYEQLRVSDPAAYMLVYKQLMAGHAPPPPPRAHDPRARQYAPHLGYPATLGYEAPERGSVHSGRSSTTGLKGNDTFYVCRTEGASGSLRGAASLRTDLSDRDLNTDASLGLQLDESTGRSERMTPFRFSTAHIKASIGSRDIVLVPASYPVDGAPATVHVLSLAAARAADPHTAELTHSPGPLVKGVTHKKSVIEYCMVRVRNAAREGAPDVVGYGLLWELLALMLRQNGVVVGSDIAELLMKNIREYPSVRGGGPRGGSGASSAASRAGSRSASPPPDAGNDYSLSETMGVDSPGSACVDERPALDKFREYLLYGNRQEALEWAMSNNLWGHALQLAASGERRLRASVAARFLAHIPRADPLHTLYAALAHLPPPAATCVSEEKWGEWRTHAAMLLANSTTRPENDAKTLTTLGDSLQSRGLWYSAQFCYVGGGVGWARHPLAPLAPAPAPAPAAAPPRLSLLLADPRARTLQQLASTRAVLATEIYEYARSLNKDYVIDELQVYKLVMACRLVDAGQYERALAYVEAAARAVTRDPAPHARALVSALADLADRLKYHDPTLLAEGAALGADEGADSAEGSPRHNQWLADVRLLAHNLQAESQSAHATPQHAPAPAHHYGWGDQALTQQYHQPVNQTYASQEEAPPCAPHYPPASQPPAPAAHAQADQYAPPIEQPVYTDQSQTFLPTDQQLATPSEQAYPRQQEPAPYQYEDWSRTEETHSQSYGDYWPPSHADHSYAYGESGGAERPAISMPGGAAGAGGAHHYASYDDDRPPSAERDDDTPKSSESKSRDKDKDKDVKRDRAGRSWIGGILTKLSLRPPNQMILPDDKNPTIVWDADAKRWRNTDGTEEDPAGAPPPPPRSQDLPHARPATSPSPPRAPPAPPAPGAAPPPVSNIFKMQKGRHIKKSYVDVFNPRGAAERARPPAADVLGPSPPALGPAPAYFVPSTQLDRALVRLPPPHTPTPPPAVQDKPVHVLIPLDPLSSPDRSPHSTPSEGYEPSDGDIPDPEPMPTYRRTGI